jgi:2-phosphosulfolactate phosphatase
LKQGMRYMHMVRKGPMVHLDWTLEGLQWALRQGRIVVIDDTLRFSTTVVTAVSRGFAVRPVGDMEAGMALARSMGAHFASREGRGRYSLSPLSFLEHPGEDNKAVVLYSPNGAACAELVKDGNDMAFVGCLLNAAATGKEVTGAALRTERDVTVIAAGEQRDLESGERIMYEKKPSRRIFAIEDYLGAGAIISHIALPKSAEALACELSFQSCRNRLEEIMVGSFSGRYLARHRRTGDVEHAARLNLYDTAAMMREGRIESVRLVETAAP